MIDAVILQRALIVGSVLQVAMTLLGHYLPWTRDNNAFRFGEMMISATAGYLYAMDFAAGYRRGAVGGAIVGGASAFLGIASSVLLGDRALGMLPVWTAVSILTGTVGGLFGQLAARMR